MTYEEIINKNKDVLEPDYKWWATHAFHFTALDNAISILKSGVLYSRIKAKQNSLMVNENASRQVISMTDFEVLSYVRFYFRPLTPTQYHNEGYKHPQLRVDDNGANISIPIFFVFRLNNLLLDRKTLFSEKSKAGHNIGDMLSGVDKFSKLNFEKIYAHSYMLDPDEEKKYRQAEILYPDTYKIDDSLELILCRSEVDRNTLLKKLKEISYITYNKYKSLIKIGKKKVFESNGLFATAVNYCNGQLTITFNDSRNKRNYDEKQKDRKNINELSQLTAKYVFKWLDAKGSQIKMLQIRQTLPYEINTVTANLPSIASAKFLSVEMYIEDDLLFANDFDLSESVIF